MEIFSFFHLLSAASAKLLLRTMVIYVNLPRKLRKKAENHFGRSI